MAGLLADQRAEWEARLNDAEFDVSVLRRRMGRPSIAELECLVQLADPAMTLMAVYRGEPWRLDILGRAVFSLWRAGSQWSRPAVAAPRLSMTPLPEDYLEPVGQENLTDTDDEVVGQPSSSRRMASAKSGGMASPT